MPISRPQPSHDIINRVYDDTDDTIKTKLVGGEISIGAVEIKDSTTDNRVTVTSDGKLLTTTSLTPGPDTTNIYGYIVDTVPSDTLTTLIDYTHSGTDGYIAELIATGTAAAEYLVFINTVFKIPYRTTAADMTFKQNMYGYKIVTGDIIQVKLKHYEIGAQDFNGSIIVQK